MQRALEGGEHLRPEGRGTRDGREERTGTDGKGRGVMGQGERVYEREREGREWGETREAEEGLKEMGLGSVPEETEWGELFWWESWAWRPGV